jgi:hypothetical protein
MFDDMSSNVAGLVTGKLNALKSSNSSLMIAIQKAIGDPNILQLCLPFLDMINRRNLPIRR